MLAIIDCGTSELESMISNIQKLGFEYSVITLPEIPSTDFYLFSHIIISGAPTILTEVGPERYIELFTFLEIIEIPVLGICLGHQIIGLLYGAEISRGKYIEKMEPLEILEQDILFDGIENRSAFQDAHSEYISLPHNFTLLAQSNSCSNEAMKHVNKNLYGVQFHPEISGESGTKVLKNFLSLN